MKLRLIKHRFGAKLGVVFLILGLMSRCQILDHRPPNPAEERADVVYQWYKFMTRLQLRETPQPGSVSV